MTGVVQCMTAPDVIGKLHLSLNDALFLSSPALLWTEPDSSDLLGQCCRV